MIDITAATREALVHGDVSPKNILAGPEGPVFLDCKLNAAVAAPFMSEFHEFETRQH